MQQFYEFDKKPDIESPEFDAEKQCVLIIEADGWIDAVNNSDAIRDAEDAVGEELSCWLYDGTEIRCYTIKAVLEFRIDQKRSR